MRQRPIRGPDGTVMVRTYGVTFPPSGHRSRVHKHEWDQLTYAVHGVMTVHTDKGIFVVPPHRAVWVPAGIEHTEEMSGPVAARSLFLVAKLARTMPRECTAVNVPPLLRELILYAIGVGLLDRKVPEHARVIGVLLDQLTALPVVPLQLPVPRDARAARVASLLRENPSEAGPLSAIARQAGASQRTIERLFRAETGMHVRQWRQRASLIHALRLLAAGESVTVAALDAGYGSTSAFIAMFKKATGTTPSKYFRRP